MDGGVVGDILLVFSILEALLSTGDIVVCFEEKKTSHCDILDGVFLQVLCW